MALLRNNGSILIFSLWILMFLTTLAVSLGLHIRQRVSLLSHLEERSQLQVSACSGIKKAISALRFDRSQSSQIMTAKSKAYLFNNNKLFKEINIGNNVVDIGHINLFNSIDRFNFQYGIVDEESKLNINTADLSEIMRLFELILDADSQRVQELANSIINWRSVLSTEMNGFYSDEYYSNLKNPYQPKHAEFEMLDELLLVKGFTEQDLHRLSSYITVYGDGLVNINTASKEVLLSLGLDEKCVGKILDVRSGLDNIEATDDDYIFQKTYDIATEISKTIDFLPSDIKQIDFLNSLKKIKVNSFYFLLTSRAKLDNKYGEKRVECVFNSYENKVQYWSEK